MKLSPSQRDRLIRKMRNNNMTQQQINGGTSSPVPRKLCLVWEDGTRMRFPYHVLFAEKYHPGEDQQVILQFLTDKLTLRGTNLAALMDYLAREPAYLYITPARYDALFMTQDFMVTEAAVEPKADPDAGKS